MPLSVTDVFVCICIAYVLSFSCMNQFNKKTLQLRTLRFESQYMVSEFFEPAQSPNNHKMMNMLSGAVASMDCEAHYLEFAWKTFKQHANFIFSGPLKVKSEQEKCSFLFLLVAEKGRTVFFTVKLKKLVNCLNNLQLS